VFRAINKGGWLDPDSSLTSQAVFMTVVGYAKQTGLSVRPHDLRRTFAKLTFKGRGTAGAARYRSATPAFRPRSGTWAFGRILKTPRATG
jgi:hypothetical protein